MFTTFLYMSKYVTALNTTSHYNQTFIQRIYLNLFAVSAKGPIK